MHPSRVPEKKRLSRVLPLYQVAVEEYKCWSKKKKEKKRIDFERILGSSSLVMSVDVTSAKVLGNTQRI